MLYPSIVFKESKVPVMGLPLAIKPRKKEPTLEAIHLDGVSTTTLNIENVKSL